jgi:hypothetical protein
MDKFVLPLLARRATVFITFDLWMSWCGFDTFRLVVDFVDDECIPQHVTVSIFEVAGTSGVALAEVIKWLLNEFGLTDRVLAYVKDDDTNLNMLATSQIFLVKCKSLGIDEPYPKIYFEHVMSKACQYGTNDTIICVWMTCVNLKDA